MELKKMIREEISQDVVRIRLTAEDTEGFAPMSFQAAGKEYLRQTGCVFTPRPVYRLKDADGSGTVLQTANGEVVTFDTETAVHLRDSFSVTLRFETDGVQILTGLGAHEDGIFDYAERSELLYEHNMKIPVPFLLSSEGWGLLILADCAMKYRGEGTAFTFELDAAEAVSYLVIRGSGCADVLRKLAGIAGLPAMLPKWAFGYIQSKEHYESAEELIATAGEFRRRGLGLDCIVQDWMTWKDGCWGDKTPDPARFPDVCALTDDLHKKQVHFMISVWPNMDQGRDSEEFAEAGLFLPASRIYNAFSKEAKDLYWKQCRRYWMDGGADALWCDSCEPITDPDWCGNEKRDPETRYRLITEASALRMDPETMNRYAAEHLRGLREHWLQDFPEKRPMLLSRSGDLSAGALGAVLWSGDISARWDVLETQVTEAVRVSMSGIPWWTVDIGAFFVDKKDPWFCAGDYPEGVKDPGYRELYVRWFQFGAMLPVFRSHGTDTPREPWQFGGEDSPEYQCLRDAIRLRYRLLPYLYASAAQTCRDGLPMIRSMLAAFPDVPELAGIHDQYMLGDALLVRPVTCALAKGGDETRVLLPPGGWYDYFTGQYYEGSRSVRISTPLPLFPLFVRAGSILPLAEGAESTADLPFPARELRVYSGADGCFDLYDDAGDGMEYLNGAFLRIPLRYTEEKQQLLFGEAEGTLPVDCDIRVEFVSASGPVRECTVHYSGSLQSADPALSSQEI